MNEIDAQSLVDASVLSKSAVAVVARLRENNYSAFIVGGAVRDLLLGKRPRISTLRLMRRRSKSLPSLEALRIIGRRFQIVHVRMGREIIEVTTFRGHHEGDSSKVAAKSNKGLLIRDNVYGTLDQDAARRDLTINALYLDPVNNLIYDDLDGLADIQRRTIRIIGDPAARYREDPYACCESRGSLPNSGSTSIHQLKGRSLNVDTFWQTSPQLDFLMKPSSYLCQDMQRRPLSSSYDTTCLGHFFPRR